MIKIADPEKALEGFLSGEDAYFEIEFESSTEHPDGNVEISFSLQQAPREIGDLLELEEDCEHDEVTLTTIDSDNSSESVFQFIFAKLSDETLETMGVTADEPVAAVLYGTTSAGEYSDDETDAYLSGFLIIGPGGAPGATAVEKARLNMIDHINSNSSHLVAAATTQLKQLEAYSGSVSDYTRQSVVELNRILIR